MGKQRLAILDRDGTLIEDRHYIRRVEDVVPYPGAPEAVLELHRMGYAVVVVSNQSGIARGLITREEFQKVHQRFVHFFREGIDEIAYCYHHPDDHCPCRKPATGLVPKQARGLPIDWEQSFVVGDQQADLVLAERLGTSFVLVRTGKGAETEAMASQMTRIVDTVADVPRLFAGTSL